MPTQSFPVALEAQITTGFVHRILFEPVREAEAAEAEAGRVLLPWEVQLFQARSAAAAAAVAPVHLAQAGPEDPAALV
jgi:hypothetical protein